MAVLVRVPGGGVRPLVEGGPRAGATRPVRAAGRGEPGPAGRGPAGLDAGRRTASTPAQAAMVATADAAFRGPSGNGPADASAAMAAAFGKAVTRLAAQLGDTPSSLDVGPDPLAGVPVAGGRGRAGLRPRAAGGDPYTEDAADGGLTRDGRPVLADGGHPRPRPGVRRGRVPRRAVGEPGLALVLQPDIAVVERAVPASSRAWLGGGRLAAASPGVSMAKTARTDVAETAAMVTRPGAPVVLLISVFAVITIAAAALAEAGAWWVPSWPACTPGRPRCAGDGSSRSRSWPAPSAGRCRCGSWPCSATPPARPPAPSPPSPGCHPTRR